MRIFKKRVIVLATSSNTRGGISAVINLHKTTKYWKHWNCIWIPTHIDKNNLFKIAYFCIAYLRFIINLPFVSLIHIHLSEPSSARRKHLFFEVARFFRIPVLVHFHAFSPDTTLNGPHRSLYSKIFTRADYVIVLSNQWKNWLIEFMDLDKSKIVVIPNPCNENIKRNVEKENKILFAGTVNRRKGYHDLIDAFALISAEHPTWNLFFAGNGELDIAEEMVNKYGLNDRVKFLNWIKGDEKIDQFSSSSIFCLPSYAEGFPMALLDAFSYGLPVITTPVGGIPDIAIHDNNMKIFDPGDVQELSKQLSSLMGNGSLREKLSLASKDLAENHFSLRNVNNLMNQLYRETYLH